MCKKKYICVKRNEKECAIPMKPEGYKAKKQQQQQQETIKNNKK